MSMAQERAQRKTYPYPVHPLASSRVGSAPCFAGRGSVRNGCIRILIPDVNKNTYETTVHGEDLFINDRGNRQTVEAIGKSLPELDVITSLA